MAAAVDRRDPAEVSWLRRAWRWAWEAPPPSGPLHETWACPQCGKPVEVETTSLTMKRVGLYLPPGRPELIALCRRQHHSLDHR